MTDIGRIQQLLDRVRYKPGWSFQIFPPDRTTPYFTLLVNAWVDNVNDVGKKLVVSMQKKFSPEMVKEISDEDFLKHCVFGTAREFELHEMDEWFKVDGKCMNEPHPEKRDQSAGQVQQ